MVKTRMQVNMRDPKLFYGRNRVRGRKHLKKILKVRPTYLWLQEDSAIVRDIDRVLFTTSETAPDFPDLNEEVTEARCTAMRRFFYTPEQTEQVK